MRIIHKDILPLGDDWCELYKSHCACLDCLPVNFCVEDPCSVCEGPVSLRCSPPEEGEE